MALSTFTRYCGQMNLLSAPKSVDDPLLEKRRGKKLSERYVEQVQKFNGGHQIMVFGIIGWDGH